jgi:protein SCO1/2
MWQKRTNPQAQKADGAMQLRSNEQVSPHKNFMPAPYIRWAFAAAATLLSCTSLCQADQRYPASGIILRVDSVHHSIEVSCREIPGYMAAMVMDFPVRKAQDLDGLLLGAIVDFTLVVSKDSARAESVRIHQFQSTEQEPMAARQLSLLSSLVESGSNGVKPLNAGQHVPDFSLVSQKPEAVTLSQFAGKIVAITFLYTHCPLPNYCFRLSNNFGVIRKRFADRMGRDLVLLSITFDPEHDQPEVLARYASNWKAADAVGWYFLTGPLAEVQKVCLEFGMNFWQDEGLFTHGLHTVVLDRKGQMVANLEGNEFTAQQLGDLLESVLGVPK